MRPLGIDLGSLVPAADWRDTAFVQPLCPGALVRVTRDDLSDMVRGGEVFEQEGTMVPRGGYGHARVRCGRELEGLVGRAGHVQYYGLCPSCSRLEADNRATLAQRPGAK